MHFIIHVLTQKSQGDFVAQWVHHFYTAREFASSNPITGFVSILFI